MYNVSLFTPSFKGCEIIIATPTLSKINERRNVYNEPSVIKRLIIGFPSKKENGKPINKVSLSVLTKDFVYEWFPFLNINIENSYYTMETTGTVGDIMTKAVSIINNAMAI